MIANPEQIVDFDALGAWMDKQGLQAGPIEDVVKLVGGTQNVVLRFRKGSASFVMRRPPATRRPESDNTMRREMRLLGALKNTDVPHPRLIAGCPDETVLGYAFYLMEAVDGFTATAGPLPVLHASAPEMRRDMGLSLIDGAAALGRVDYLAVGLDNFGKPENFLDRQVVRWHSHLNGYSQHKEWPGPNSLPGVEKVSAFLTAKQPKSFKPGIMHGDYSLSNVMFRKDSPKLAAIVDWELATIGDPLIDLGWILATWHGDPTSSLSINIVEPWEGFPTPDELVAHYGRQSDRDLSNIEWYFVFGCYKLAIILEGTFARGLAGHDPMETGERLHAAGCELMQRALRRIA